MRGMRARLTKIMCLQNVQFLLLCGLASGDARSPRMWSESSGASLLGATFVGHQIGRRLYLPDHAATYQKEYQSLIGHEPCGK